jgi:hypothetical protein
LGNIGKSISDQASQGNILGRIKDSVDRGAALRKAEQEKEWSGGLLGKIGIPNPMKLFGGERQMEGEGVLGDLWRSGAKTIREYSGMKEPEVKSTPLFDYTDRDAVEKRFYGSGKPYTFEEWDDKICSDNPHSRLYKKGQQIKARGEKWRGLSLKEWDEKLCSGEDSLLAKKKRAIDARAAKKKPASAPAKKQTQDDIDEGIRKKQDVELAKLDTYANPNLSQVARMRMLMSGERPMVREEGDQDKFNELAAQMAKGNITRKEAVKAIEAPKSAPVRYANAQEARDALKKSMMRSSSSQKDLFRQLSAAMRR